MNSQNSLLLTRFFPNLLVFPSFGSKFGGFGLDFGDFLVLLAHHFRQLFLLVALNGYLATERRPLLVTGNTTACKVRGRNWVTVNLS